MKIMWLEFEIECSTSRVKSRLPQLKKREKELLDIALQLTSPAYTAFLSRERLPNADEAQPDPMQLLNQAETIATLLAQRDLLLERSEAERAQWESERESWDRTAEVLLISKSGGGQGKGTNREDTDLERQCALFESDNKHLREKLAATQTRLSSLESELSKLRPLLLLNASSLNPQTEAESSSNSTNFTIPMTIYGTSSYLSALIRSPLSADLQTNKPNGKGKEREIPHENDTAPSSSSNPVAAPSRRQRIQFSKPMKTMNSAFSDARSEHLLLAARRLGHLRTNALSNIAFNRDKARAELLTGRPSEDTERIPDARDTVNASPVPLPQTPKAKGRRPSGIPTVSPNAITVMTPTGIPATVTPTGASPYAPWYGYSYYPQGMYVTRPPYGINMMAPGVPSSPTGGRSAVRTNHDSRPPNPNGRTSLSASGSGDGAAPLAGPSSSKAARPQQSSLPQSGDVRTRNLPTRSQASPTPLDSLLSAARMMDRDVSSADQRAPTPTPAQQDEESAPTTRSRPARQRKKQPTNKPSTTKPTGTTAGKGRRGAKATTAPSNDQIVVTSNTRSRRSKRQGEAPPDVRPSKRRKSDPIPEDSAEAEGVGRTRGSSASTNASGPRLISSPQVVAATDDGVDSISRSSSRPVERTRSALDVLADQASVVASESATRRPTSSHSSHEAGADDDEQARRRTHNEAEDRDDVGSSTRPLRSSRLRRGVARESNVRSEGNAQLQSSPRIGTGTRSSEGSSASLGSSEDPQRHHTPTDIRSSSSETRIPATLEKTPTLESALGMDTTIPIPTRQRTHHASSEGLPTLSLEVIDETSPSELGDIAIISPTPAPSATSEDSAGRPNTLSTDDTSIPPVSPSDTLPFVPSLPPRPQSSRERESHPSSTDRPGVSGRSHHDPPSLPSSSGSNRPSFVRPLSGNPSRRPTDDSAKAKSDGGSNQIIIDDHGLGEDAEGDEDAEGEPEGDQECLYEAIQFPVQETSQTPPASGTNPATDQATSDIRYKRPP
ncbi:hypothetical protein ONZ45_g5101 [Pleurotus djamor]|nr:hypothetical protein ONZ45_g5101 [Pleurotus djamor]